MQQRHVGPELVAHSLEYTGQVVEVGARVPILFDAWGQSLSSLPLTIGQVYLVLPIAGVLIVFFSLVHIVGILSGAENPIAEIDENAEAI